jgi:hypothetical protein
VRVALQIQTAVVISFQIYGNIGPVQTILSFFHLGWPATCGWFARLAGKTKRGRLNMREPASLDGKVHRLFAREQTSLDGEGQKAAGLVTVVP